MLYQTLSHTLKLAPHESPSRRTLNNYAIFYAKPSRKTLNNFGKPSTTLIIPNIIFQLGSSNKKGKGYSLPSLISTSKSILINQSMQVILSEVIRILHQYLFLKLHTPSEHSQSPYPHLNPKYISYQLQLYLLN